MFIPGLWDLAPGNLTPAGTELLKAIDYSQLFSLNISYWVLQSVAMLLTAFFIPGLRITNPLGALATVVALAFINSKVWDAALFFEVPNHFSSQALSLLVVNGVIFWIVVKLLPGIEVDGILPALAAPLVFTVTSWLISEYGTQVDWPKVYDACMKQIEFYRQQFMNASAHPSAIRGSQ